MATENIKLNELETDGFYNHSYPLRPDLLSTYKKMFPGFPSLIINKNNILIFGYDYLEKLKNDGKREQETKKVDLDRKDSLILGFNIRKSLLGFNNYEKVVFLNKIIKLANLGEIYERTAPDVRISEKFIENMEVLLSSGFKDLLISNRISINIAVKICSFSIRGRDSLLNFFMAKKFSVSRQQIILNMIKYISHRDKKSVSEILKDAGFKTGEGNENNDEIFSRLEMERYPKYSEYKKKWMKSMVDPDFSGKVRINPPLFFESDQFDLTLKKISEDELKKILKILKL